MTIDYDIPLAPFTSLNVGGRADRLVTITDSAEIPTALLEQPTPHWYLGHGTNMLISDVGLPGTTLLFRTSNILEADGLLIADAGIWWDDLVRYAITRGLWGLELMSGIPGGVGGAIVGNIAAYGQAVSDTLAWVEVCDPEHNIVRRYQPGELALSYRYSDFQQDDWRHLIVLRAAFRLSHSPVSELTYEAALSIARDKSWDTSTLAGRRQIIMEARARAGSLWDYRDQTHDSHTAGSFFRNPLVSPEQVERLIAYDESGKTAEQISKMNRIHGGSSQRVSAAHVLLAAGFQRGQTWHRVRLHPQHVLKIETLDGAVAQEVYDVSTEIVKTVKTKLGIDLQPEPRFLGEF